MTEQTQTQEQAPNPNDKGLPPGITANLTEGGNRDDGAPKAPEVNNAPPKEPTPEEKAAAEQKAKETSDAEKAKTVEAEEAQKKADEEALKTATEYEDYKDANANAVVEMLKEAKVPVQEAHELFKEAIETGDFSKIDVSKLTEKLGAAKATLVLNGVQTYYNSVTANTKETVNTVYKEVGGEANYKKVQTWARSVAAKDPAFATKMEGYNAMFDLNPTAAVMAAKELVALYEKSGDNSSLNRKQVHGERAHTTQDSTGDHLSRHDYLEQMKVAQAKGDTHEINRLRAQRAASHNTKQ
jgi:hypothetical protein